MDVEGAIKKELRRKLLFMTFKKNVLVHWDESEAFWKVRVVIWGGKKYKWRQYLDLFIYQDLCLESSQAAAALGLIKFLFG